VEAVGGEPILVGHSMGGLVVQRYLENRTHPGAVLLGSVPISGALATTVRVARHHPIAFLKANLQLRLGPIVGSEELVRELLFSEVTPAAVVRETFSRLQDESYLAFLSMILRRPRPARVTSPVLVLGGEADRIFTARQVRATAEAYGTNATIMAAMGHDLMLDDGWENVAETIRGWLESRD
jgi:alpha-beta hydrolase superfamily lysophospholipase